jgi:trigger factor
MEFTVKDESSVKKTFHVEIPREEVRRELDKAYNELKKSVKLKGFRPGKVPRSVLEQRFGKEVRSDVSMRLIQSSMADAIKQSELNIVSQPQVDPPELDISTAYAYDATVEISPQIEDLDFKGLELKRPAYRVTEKEIDAQIKSLQKSLAQHQKISEQRPAQDGDIVLIDYEGFKDGQPFAGIGKSENFTLKIGAEAISKNFDEALIGMTPGDTREIEVSFPDDFGNQDLAGQDTTFKVALNEIREELLPPIDDELARKAGPYENLTELRQQIRQNLEQGYAKRVEQELNEQIFSQLLEKSDFEVPDSVVEAELEGIIEEAERSFSYRNTSMEELGLTRESIAEKYQDTAVKQVKRHYILSKIVDQEHLELSDRELDEGFNEMAQNFNHPVEEIKGFYNQNQDKLALFKHTLLEKKAIKLIIDSSKISDVEPESDEDSDKKVEGKA